MIRANSGKPPAATPASNRQSVFAENGKGLMGSGKAASVSAVNSATPAERSNLLRQSANSQIAGGKSKYTYHKSQVSAPNQQVGEYMTKEARNETAKQVKASHF